MQLNWLLRYQPVVRLLEQRPPGTILDVGSGWHGLSAYVSGEIIQTDLAFASPTQPVAGFSPVLVAASADALPFTDGAVDCCVSLDMVEHLPDSIRISSVRELCRVSRGAVIIGFPVGSAARRVDSVLDRLLGVLRRPSPDWLMEHLGQERYPTVDVVVDGLPPGWRISRVVGSGNVVLLASAVLAEELPGTRRVCARLERRWRRRGVPRLFDGGSTYRRIYLLEAI
ncbi:MAG TPA: methyltransferase domain-containing protein [Actinomycetes bacterium]|nr:methyltransferase domain-containing protein [Actinomycetes bacterium]